MFNPFEKKTDERLDRIIERVKEDMEMYGPGSDEWKDLLPQLERLEKLREEKAPEPVSRNTLLTVAGQVVGILIIVAYEQKHVLTSKAIAVWMRPK